MTTDSLDSHDIYTTVRTSWATRLTQPTEYGIADALGQDTTHQVLEVCGSHRTVTKEGRISPRRRTGQCPSTRNIRRNTAMRR
jgi:hypothetical protein